MTETITTKNTVCDCCHKQIQIPPYIISSARDSYFSKGSIDICNSCAINIGRHLMRQLSEDELKIIADECMPHERRYNLPDGVSLC